MKRYEDFLPVKNLLVVGLGLLGGSVCLAARKRHMARQITTVALRPGSNHDEAQQAGLIDRWSNDLEASVASASLVILAQPVDAICAILPRIMKAAKPGTVVTDVGSTKKTICAAGESVASEGQFVGSHPMAGSHLVGWRNAKSDLFVNRPCYVTTSEKTDLTAAAHVGRFWKGLGSRIIMTTPERHDHLAAMVSHVPHLAAAAIVECLDESHEDPEFLKLVVGSGFKDATRIAMGSADIWQEICQHNASEISTQLRRLAGSLTKLADYIDGNDQKALGIYLDAASKYRERFNHDS